MNTPKYRAASVFKIYEKYLRRSSTLVKLCATLTKNWTSSQVFFDWFYHSFRTDFLYNTSQWLPMCAAWRKKNERNEIVWFYCTQSDILLCGIARFSQGNKNKLRTFQPQKWNKIKNSQLQTKYTGSYNKKECSEIKLLQTTRFYLI